MKTLNTPVLTCLAWMLFALASPVLADAEKGLAIAKEMKARDTGWGDMQAEMKMTLKNAQGQESLRQLRIKNLEVLDDGDKSLSIFDEPRDVEGTAFLSYSHPLEADEQWLYLPALKRVKRIASRNKSGPFMGSEFAYEDLSSFEIEKYSYNFLREEACGDQQCFVLESTPLDKDSGYTRRIGWIDTEHYRMMKVEFYDRRNALLKTLTSSDYKLYKDKFWRANKMEMVNHQNGKSTTLEWLDIRFDNGFSENDFNINTLKRAR